MQQPSLSAAQEQQLTDLRQRLRELRIAKKWVQEYRINAPASVSSHLSAYYNWLVNQEQNTIAMGKRVKGDH